MTPLPEITDALLPCPFCGKQPKLVFNHQTDSGECWAVECGDCDTDRWGAYRHSTEEAQKSAITAWNTRHTASNNQEVAPHGVDVKKVARAIALHEWNRKFTALGHKTDGELPDEANWTQFVGIARAALSAIGTKSEPGSGDELVEALIECRNELALCPISARHNRAILVADTVLHAVTPKCDGPETEKAAKISTTNTEPTVGESEHE